MTEQPNELSAVAIFERLVNVDTRVTVLAEDFRRIRESRHDDRAEVARLALAYEQTRSEIADLKAEVRERFMTLGGEVSGMRDEFVRLAESVNKLTAAVVEGRRTA